MGSYFARWQSRCHDFLPIEAPLDFAEAAALTGDFF